jgi:hypothetical protein
VCQLSVDIFYYTLYVFILYNNKIPLLCASGKREYARLYSYFLFYHEASVVLGLEPVDPEWIMNYH